MDEWCSRRSRTSARAKRRLALPVALAAALALPGCVGHTDDATSLTATSATLNAHGKSTNGSARAFFRWGVQPNALTNSTPGINYPANVEGPHAETITGLSPSTTYYFRACATDNAGTLCAELHDFRTLTASGEGVVAVAGDIGDDTPRPNGQDNTGALVAGMDPHKVLTLGDNAYENGTLAEYEANFRPWWGDPHGVDRGGPNGFGDRLRPALGNHETPSGGEGTYDFFNGQYSSGGSTINLQFGLAGVRGQGYYVHDVGSWRLIALNSRNGGSIEQAQLDWLAARVSENPRPCLLAYWHHPRWTSRDGGLNDDPDMASIWSRLWSASAPSKRADLILNGHVHHYDRFARQNLSGGADANGMRQITVGTGGVELHNFQTIHPRSERRIQEHGVLKLTLRANSAVGQFIDATGNVDDSFTEVCH
jgi:calcineurin-like phosphoesterase family protein